MNYESNTFYNEKGFFGKYRTSVIYKWSDIKYIKAYAVEHDDDWDETNEFIEIYFIDGFIVKLNTHHDYGPTRFYKIIEGMHLFLPEFNTEWRKVVYADLEKYRNKDQLIRFFWNRYYRNKPIIFSQ